MIDKGRIGSALFMFGAMLVVLIATGTSSLAQSDHHYDDRANCYGSYGRNNMYRIAEENGYRDGVEHGREHRVERQRYDPRGTRHYKDGVEGYCSAWNDKDAYKRVYREAFLRGYDVGYRGSGYRDDPYDRNDPYSRNDPYRNDPYYGERRGGYDDYRYGGNRNDVYRIAQENGYREGVRAGEDDRNQRRSYSYDRHDHYRDADSGYRSEYRDRELYRQGYRDGYRRGYDAGYGRGNRGWGGIPRSRWPIPWPF